MINLNKIYKKINKPINLDNNIYMHLLKNNKYSSDILKMRNDPLNIRFSLTKKKIQALTHKIWIKNFLQNKNFLFMIFNLKKKIGYLRLDKNKNELIISIFIKKNSRKKKIGSLCLKYISQEFKKFKLVAYVVKQNKRSIFFFKKNGFKILASSRKLIII
jgi:RimJ/RimL family protein N-acetyltransferase